MTMDRDAALKAFQELIDNVRDFAENDLIVLNGDGEADTLLPDAIAAHAVLSGTCATCANRLASGSCELDVQDPAGEAIDGSSIMNWKNRDTFGCTEWDATRPTGGPR